MTQAAGIAAIEANETFLANCRGIMENREYTTRALSRLGFTVLPSKANFVFARHATIPGGTLYTALKARGVLVRHFTRAEIDPYLRITIGTRQQMDILLTTLKEIITKE